MMHIQKKEIIKDKAVICHYGTSKLENKKCKAEMLVKVEQKLLDFL